MAGCLLPRRSRIRSVSLLSMSWLQNRAELSSLRRINEVCIRLRRDLLGFDCALKQLVILKIFILRTSLVILFSL